MSRTELLAWLESNAVRADHLGPCARCGELVRAGDECSGCLEDDGQAIHERECDGHREEAQLVEAILAHAEDQRAANVVRRIHARITELEPLQAFGGSLGAVYAAEAAGLRYALELLEAPTS
jgi:hypothetical protein